jgi:hypothetical protein
MKCGMLTRPALSYLYRFIERDDRQSEWKFRQIGVYCAYVASSSSYLYVFLQPHPDSKFDSRMEMLQSRPDSTATLLADPFRMHEILIGTYFDNWRWYLREMADMFKSDVSILIFEKRRTGHPESANGTLDKVRRSLYR